nr:exodeoxyribonuclease I [Thiopseudomonas sp.]
PVIAPLSVLRDEDTQRLAFDHDLLQRNYQLLSDSCADWQDKLAEVYQETREFAEQDVEQQLYSGFLSPRDRQLSNKLRLAEPEQLQPERWPFDDARLLELLFRYRARHYPDSLSAAEQQQWTVFCRARLSGEQLGAPLTISDYMTAYAELSEAEQAHPAVQAWRSYVQALQQRYQLS